MSELIIDPDFFNISEDDWEHFPGFLPKEEADKLYITLVDREWQRKSA